MVVTKIRSVCLWHRMLSLVLIITSAVVCEAQFGGGSGTQEDPWQIGRIYHLDDLRNYLGPHHVDKYYIQTANIDLDIAPWNEGTGWEPIGDRTYPFQGHYDGNGYIINRLYIYRPGYDYQGLFGGTQGATIVNLGLTNIEIWGKDALGGLVGWNTYYSTVDNCFSTGVVIGNTNIGGLMGYNGVYSVLTNSYSTCTVTGTDARAASLVGYNDHSIISNCYSTGNVSGYRQIGGLVGRNALSSVINSYSTGTVNGNNLTGGLVGVNAVNAVIEYSYSIGRVTGVTTTGGLVGGNENSAVRDSYWNTQTSQRNNSAGGTGRTTVQMTSPHDANTYSGWNFTNQWVEDFNFTINNGYPFLSWQDRDYPDVAVHPQPENRVRGVSIDLSQLGWQYLENPAYSNPLGFRVYFNSTGDFNIFDLNAWVDFEAGVENYFTSEIIPDLDYAATYYWLVIPTTEYPNLNVIINEDNGINNRGDAYNCPVWSFTTEIHPYPVVAVNPDPINEATDISVYRERLFWSYLSDEDFTNPIGFRVYLNETGVFADDDEFVWVNYYYEQQRFSSANILPFRLSYDTTYYWKVVPTISNPNEATNTRIYSLKKSKANRKPVGDAEDVPIWSFTTENDTSVDENNQPQITELYGNYPNPFNPSTLIVYSLGMRGDVELTVYNILGQIVRKLHSGIQDAGTYQVVWDGRDDKGKELNSGVYFYRLKTTGHNEVRKMLMIR